jgi:hypothetical protein
LSSAMNTNMKVSTTKANYFNFNNVIASFHHKKN